MARMRKNAWRELYPFQSHYFELQEPKPCCMHYLDEGQGEAVVMLHGNPTWSFYYRNLVQHLSPNYRCLVPDHIGCGLSDKPQSYPYQLAQHVENIRQWLKALQVERFHLVVHDWGGAIGMGVATQVPDCVQSITILNSAAFLSDRIPLRIELCRIPWLGSWAIRRLNLFAKAAVRMAAKKPLAKAVRRGYLLPYDSAKHRIAIDRFVKDIPMDSFHPSYGVLKHIQDNLCNLSLKPCQLAWGMRDFCFTPEFLAEWQKYFPNARVRCFDDAGHYVLEDAHGEIEPFIGQFLQQCAINKKIG